MLPEALDELEALAVANQWMYSAQTKCPCVPKEGTSTSTKESWQITRSAKEPSTCSSGTRAGGACLITPCPLPYMPSCREGRCERRPAFGRTHKGRLARGGAEGRRLGRCGRSERRSRQGGLTRSSHLLRLACTVCEDPEPRLAKGEAHGA